MPGKFINVAGSLPEIAEETKKANVLNGQVLLALKSPWYRKAEGWFSFLAMVSGIVAATFALFEVFKK